MVQETLDREKDLDALVTRGEQLHLAIQAECLPDQFQAMLKKEFGEPATQTLLLAVRSQPTS
jgi:hypothetical protein